MSNERYIYCLIDPEISLPFYVGCTVDPTGRIYDHVYNSIHDMGAATVDQYIKKLSEKNAFPILDILEMCLAEESDEAEKRWIKRFREWGFPIINIQYRGELIDKKRIYVKGEGMINAPVSKLVLVTLNFSWLDYKSVAERCGIAAQTVRLGVRNGRINSKVWEVVLDQLENGEHSKGKNKGGRPKAAVVTVDK